MDQGKRPIRPLLPKDSADPGQSAQNEPVAKKQRVTTKTACDRCHSHKAACDNKRPVCSRCQRKGVDCVYQTKDADETLGMAKNREINETREKLKEYENVLRHLRDVSAPNALASLHSLRSASSLSAFVSENNHTRQQALPSTSQTQTQIPIRKLVSGPENEDSQEVRSSTSLRPSGPSSSQSSTSQQLLQLLVDTSHDTSQAILQQLRERPSPQTILDLFHGNSTSTVRLSAHQTARSVTPPVQSPREFQLMVQHPGSYPRLDPELHEKRGYHPPELLSVSNPELPTASDSTSREPPAAVPHLDQTQDTGIGPVKPPRYFDPRLASLDIQVWSRVPVDDTLATEIISLHLDLEYSILGSFDLEVFVSGLATNGFSKCSPFQVNSLLAFACQGYSKSPLATPLSYQFAAEATRLWQQEPTITPASISGLIYLYIFYTATGKGGTSFVSCLNDIAAIAKRMHLFGCADRKTAADFNSLPQTIQRTMAHAAWTGYNFLIMQSLFWTIDPVDYPPLLPIPSPDTYGMTAEERDQLEEATLTKAVRENYTFTAFSHFWKIAGEVLMVFHAPNSNSKPSLMFAFLKYQKLLHWVDSLPLLMERKGTSPMHVWVFHIWYHVFILEIFRPFVTAEKQHDLSSWSTSSSTPEAIFSASVKQLKHMVVTFRRQQACALYTFFWHAGVMSVANAVLKNSSDPNWRFYFMLCIFCYRDLAPCFPISEQIAQGFLAIAVESGLVTSAEATLYLDEFNVKAHKGVEDRSHGKFVLDLDLAVSDKDMAQIGAFVDKYDKIKTPLE